MPDTAANLARFAKGGSFNEYVAGLGRRAERIRNRPVSPETDNMLKVSGDSRRAVLDLRRPSWRADLLQRRR